MAKRIKNLVGVDIDPSGITVAQVAVNGRINVEAAAFAPLEPGIVRDGEVIDSAALGDALRTLFRDNKGLGKRVRVGVANQKIVVRPLELPYLSDTKELAAAVRFHAADQLPMAIDQAVIDYQPLEVVQGPDSRLQRLLLVAARRDMVANVVTAVRAAGLRPEGVDLSAFAMIRALYRPGAADEHVLYLAIGGLTNLAVAKGTACLFTRASGGGVEALAVELAETCSLTLDHARGWLEHVGLQEAVEDIEGDETVVRTARRVLLEGARRIAAEVRNSLDFHHGPGRQRRRRARGRLRPRVGHPRLRRRPVLRARPAGHHRRRRRRSGRLRRGPPRRCRRTRDRGGAGMKAVNLIPADDAAGGKGRSGAGAYAVIGVLAVLVVMSAAYALVGRSVSTKRGELSATTAQADSAEAQAAKLKTYSEFSQLRQSREETVKKLVDGRFDWAGAFREVSRTIPSGSWVMSLRATTTASAGVDGTTDPLRSAIPAPAIEMAGCANTQAGVARTVTSLRGIAGVQRVTLSSSQKMGRGDSGSASDSAGQATGCGTRPQFSLTIFYKTTDTSAAPATSGGTTP